MWSTRRFWMHSETKAGTAATVEGASPPAENRDGEMGWLSLTSDADGPSRHEHDVLCMGIIPDDLDVHDEAGGDLSWIGLLPVTSVEDLRG